MNIVTKELVDLLKEKKLKLSVCESASCGALASSIGEIPGASSVFVGGIVSYTNLIKEKIVGVSKKILEEYGAISAQTAYEMCKQTNLLMNSDLCISITGNAGPSGDEEKPVGLFYVGVAIMDIILVKEYRIDSINRDYNRFKIALEATQYLIEILKK